MGKPISVTYSYKKNVHFFTSDNPEFKGLLVFSADLKKAFDEVAVQLNYLLKSKGVPNPDIKPCVPYEEFHELVMGSVSV